jgi:hypothetical protein
MNTIHKIEATDKLLQVHFYQIFNRKPLSLNIDDDIDISGLNEKYPGFLENFDFTNVDTHDLLNFFTTESRQISKYHLPKYFFCFWGKNIEDLFNILEFENFPFLFTDYESSTFNDLVGIYYYNSIFIYNQKGEFLNISKIVYDGYDEFYKLYFINEEYLCIYHVYQCFLTHSPSISYYYKYINGKIESYEEINSIELLELFDERKIPWSLSNLSLKLRNNKSVILKFIKSNQPEPEWLHEYIYDQFMHDKEIVLELVECHSIYFKRADYSLQIDYSFILEAIKRNELVFQYVDVLFKADKDFVFKAVKKNGKVLQYVDDSYKAKKDFVLEAVKENGLALEFASATLQEDKELAIAAVKNDGMSLEFASASLQEDKEVVLQAIKNNYNAFRYCSELLLNDVDFICEAYKLNINIMNYINATKINYHSRLQELFDDYKSREEEQEEKDDLPF